MNKQSHKRIAGTRQSSGTTSPQLDTVDSLSAALLIRSFVYNQYEFENNITTDNPFREVYTMIYKDLFDKKRLKHVADMRAKYFATGSFVGIEGVREEILTSWKESYEAGIHISDTKKPALSKKELTEAQRNSENLIKVAVPYMEKLNSFLKKDCFWITLLDSNGIVIKMVGAEKAKKIANSTGLMEGSYRGSGVYYTGLFKMCGAYNKPVQIVSTEHSSAIDDDLAGAAAPIMSKETGERIGIIGISGYWWETHAHTLGLTILAAEAISQQLVLRSRNSEIKNINERLDSALESTNMGIVYIEKNGTILTINSRAAEMLSGGRKKKEEYLSDCFFGYIGGKKRQNNIETEINEEIATSGEYKCVIRPIKGNATLHCTIRKTQKDSEANYIVQIYKRSEINKIVADTSLMSATFNFDDIIGESNKMCRLKEQARIAAQYSNTALILGESGTGKELFAQAIHNASRYSKGPFVAVNCGAIPKSLLESELFGYEAGTFTGAQKNGKPGKFEIANGGTLFLDEIGDMPYEMQTSLLRALQTKSFVRVGGEQSIGVDIMIIAATNKNVEKQIIEGTFREDLYYRLNVFTLTIPPLRERIQDVEILANYFFGKKCNSIGKNLKTISYEAMNKLKEYEWPGNVRELENVIERAVILCNKESISEADLPENVSGTRDMYSEQISAAGSELASGVTEKVKKDYAEDKEKTELIRLMIECNGNVSAASRKLGISRPAVYRRLKRHGIYEDMRKTHIGV